ncbi:hypothetical protein Sliba_13550 [Streptomyces nigrescens]|uniref:Uncharacterized protein n=1 Tax=Streptomyces nigrescens TaxID=1920 RepID=A0A640TD15_STRNI|nr:hypothetical protein Sliba_13550 [Streptomyces libani subsp. libani]GGV88415.1 hypothetical protein GCM10010500_10950 [Streptomyces libani subsp. libani]
MEITGDVREEAGQHELGGALGEDRKAEQIENEGHSNTPQPQNGSARRGGRHSGTRDEVKEETVRPGTRGYRARTPGASER